MALAPAAGDGQTKRSWNPRGARRAEFRYDRLADRRKAWRDDGTPRSKPEAEAQAAADEGTGKQLLAVPEALIHDHPPHCD